LHPRFEPLGAGVRFGHLTRCLGELLVRHRERDVIGDSTRDRHVCGPNACGRFDQKPRPISWCARG